MAGCSSLPDPRWPKRLVGTLVLERAVDNRYVPLPESDDTLTILELETEPTGDETHRNGLREIRVPSGHDTLKITIRYRLFVDPEAPPPAEEAAALVVIRCGGGEVVSHDFGYVGDPGHR